MAEQSISLSSYLKLLRGNAKAFLYLV